MAPLASYLNSLDVSRQWDRMGTIIEKSRATTTQWGSRVVKAKGYKGFIYLSDLTKKVLVAGRQRCDADDLTVGERIQGIKIARKLNKFYQVTDKEIKRSPLLIKILDWIREFTFCYCWTTRFWCENKGEAYFRAYSERNFLKTFGGELDHLGEHPRADGSFGPPLRVLAKAKYISKLKT